MRKRRRFGRGGIGLRRFWPIALLRLWRGWRRNRGQRRLTRLSRRFVTEAWLRGLSNVRFPTYGNPGHFAFLAMIQGGVVQKRAFRARPLGALCTGSIVWDICIRIRTSRGGSYNKRHEVFLVGDFRSVIEDICKQGGSKLKATKFKHTLDTLPTYVLKTLEMQFV